MSGLPRSLKTTNIVLRTGKPQKLSGRACFPAYTQDEHDATYLFPSHVVHQGKKEEICEVRHLYLFHISLCKVFKSHDILHWRTKLCQASDLSSSGLS